MTITQAGPVPDVEQEIKNRVAAEYIQAGYARTASDGTTVPDEDKMKARAVEVVVGAVVTTKKNRSENSVTQGELYAAVFPDGPGVKPNTFDTLDFFDAQVRERLQRKVWSLTQPGPKGYIQRRLGEGTLVLCRGTVMREMDELPGVYVTDMPELIMDDSLAPQIDKLVRVASELQLHAAMIATRHPELEQKVTGALGLGITRVKAAAQLTMSGRNGADAGDQAK